MAEPEAIPAAVPPVLPPPPMDRLDDFPDRLSPMLVKELRQGLRTHTFVILFLVLQGLLALVLLTAGAAASSAASQSAGNIVSQIVFCFYALALLVVQPMRGVSSIHHEIKQNTIDLMVLTRLSAWRIIFGKWSSIVSQSVLIFLAVIPYLILRYFFGGMQLFAELFLMVYILIVSGVFTAITIGLSAVSNIIIRGLVPIGGALVVMVLIFSALTPGLTYLIGYLSSSSDWFLGALGLLTLAIYTGYFFLELAAGMIAPAAENRTTRKRIIGLLVLTATFWSLQHRDAVGALVASSFVLFLLSLDLFTERARFPAVVCRPFLRFGALGRLFGRFFYPGWPTGTLFFTLLGALLAGFLVIHDMRDGIELEAWAMLGVTLAILAFPAALIQLFLRRTEQRFSIYAAIFICCWILTLILSVLADVINEDALLWIFSPIPTMFLPLGDEAWHSHEIIITILGWGFAGIYYLIVFASALPHLRTIKSLEIEELERGETNDDS